MIVLENSTGNYQQMLPYSITTKAIYSAADKDKKQQYIYVNMTTKDENYQYYVQGIPKIITLYLGLQKGRKCFILKVKSTMH
jgi:hypothetical protein